jgi:NADPH2:quinone reductase
LRSQSLAAWIGICKAGEVRVRVLAAGVSLPDLLMREGVHPETPPVPFTPGWDLVGVVDRLGDGISGIEPGQIVASCYRSNTFCYTIPMEARDLESAARQTEKHRK